MAMTPHVTAEQIERFRRGDVTPDEFISVGRHLATCEVCSSEGRRAANLTELRDAMVGDARPRPRYLPLVAAAAIVLIAIAAVLFFTRRTAPPTVRRPPVEIVRNLPAPPIIAELRGDPDLLRGNHPAAAAMQPSGVVVETDRPRFTWSGTAGAPYVVSVFDASKTLVAESPRISEPSWTPSAPLPRGANYSWEVEIRHGDDVSIIPAPPAPPARFRVLDETSLRKLATTSDPFARGVLYARFGVQQRAIEELRASHDPNAPRLLEQVRRW